MERPRVGIGVLIFKDEKLLLSERLSSHAAGLYCGPGGHLEFGETPEECAVREVAEETGVEIQNIRVVALANLISEKAERWHYIQINLAADWKLGEPENREPEKHAPWSWYDLNALPSPLVFGISETLEAMKTGKAWTGTIRI